MSHIYISSTQEDLRLHREAIALNIRRLGHSEVAMENYVAGGPKPLDRCLADVRRSDLYVGIFARRYGHRPAGRQESITELELLEAERNGIDCLCFLLDDTAEWPASATDEGDDAAAVDRLRAHVSEHHLVSYFSDPGDLAALATAAIVNALSPVATARDPARERRLFNEWRAREASQGERITAQTKLANMASPLYLAEIKHRLLEGSELSPATSAGYLSDLARFEGRRQLIPFYLDLLNASDATVRTLSVVALGELAHSGMELSSQVLQEFVALATDPSPRVRAELAHALGKLTADDLEQSVVRSALAALASDGDSRVRRRATQSIQRRDLEGIAPARPSGAARAHVTPAVPGELDETDMTEVRALIAQLREEIRVGPPGRMVAATLQGLVETARPDLSRDAQHMRETAHDVDNKVPNVTMAHFVEALDDVEAGLDRAPPP